jgi:hypothetical protein
MKWKYILLFLLSLPMLSPQLQAQFEEEEPKKLTLDGYVKYLQSSTYTPLFDVLTTNNLIHNRLNLAWYPTSKLRFKLEARNRIFWGEEVKLTPNYGELVDQYDGLFDLSIRWIDNPNWLWHTVVDRAYVEYATDKVEMRAGRQRINWGINTVWNPNDLFNAFNYLDFDYEERPGSDAIRLTYYSGVLSSTEIAFAPDTALDQSVGALMHKFNAFNYDLQVLGGYYRGDIALGMGWAGYIGGAGFKGEASYFIPTNLSDDSLHTFTATVSGDYQLGKVYLIGSVYFNHRGATQVDLNELQGGLLGAQLSAKNLFPTQWAFFVSASGQFTPLISGSLGAIYSPNGHLTTLIPTLAYSIKENWDIDLVGQLFFLEDQEKFKNLVDGVFLRLRWSY